MNILFPKFASNNYPHHMMKLQLAATVITIHLGLMTKLSQVMWHDESYTQEDIDEKTDIYIKVLTSLIQQAAIYRIESLFGTPQKIHELEVGGIITHSYNLNTKIYALKFKDNFTDNEVDLKNLPSADLITKPEDPV